MPSERFDSFIKRLREATIITSQASLAKTLSISRAAITQAKKNDSIPIKWITELSRLFNVNPDWLEKGTGSKVLRQNIYHEIFLQVPKVKARLSAGGGSFETEPDMKEFYSFRKDWLSKKGKARDKVLMDIFGNSMGPELKEGDIHELHEVEWHQHRLQLPVHRLHQIQQNISLNSDLISTII